MKSSQACLVAAVIVSSFACDPAVRSEPPTERSQSHALLSPPVAVREWSTVPLPRGVTSWSFARYMPDGGIVTAFTSSSVDHSLIGHVREDGTDFRCLTCDLDGDLDLGRPKPFADGRRVLLQSPSNDSTLGKIRFYVLECAPSVARCDSAKLLEIAGTDDASAIQTRIASISPDGSKLAWNRIRSDGYGMLFGTLVREAERYRVEDVRVLTEPTTGLRPIDASAARAAWYEAKGFTPDGASIVFSGTRDQALNLDAYLLDVATGETRRLTTDPDWDEWASVAPDATSFAQSSSRGANRTDVFGAFPRLPLVDFAVVGPLFNYFLPRKLPGQVPDASTDHKQYVFAIAGEPSGDSGSLIQSPEDLAWTSRHPTFSPDSARVLWSAARGSGETRETRLRIAHLAREGASPVRVRPTPTPWWAPSIDAVPRRDVTGIRTFRGAAGGFATTSMFGDLRFGHFEVRYHAYSSDGCSVMNGVQRVETTTMLSAHYTESLTLTGCHEGRSNLDFTFGGKDTHGAGEVTLDGEHYTKVITPER